MKSRSLLVAVASLICCLSAEARFDSRPFLNVPKATPTPSAPVLDSRKPSDGDRQMADSSRAGEQPKADRRVKAALDAMKQKYAIEKNGIFTFTIAWEADGDDEEARSQLVQISSETEFLHGHEIREIWSRGLVASHLTRNDLAYLLAQNETYKIGAWGIVRSSEGREHLIFTAKVPADLPPQSLVGIASTVAKVADTFEQKSSGKDDL